ncbi:phage portal protein [Paeniglutamicibacter sp. NPDC012692]|uniref:phage portal protein n=1 Tax=Paeniglutamicibacter sp. NPDC012692 TaxID=3364388 RepID=UPI0036905753
MSTRDAASLSDVYRAMQIITTATLQVTHHVERGGLRLDDSETPSLIKTPCLDMSPADFFEQTVMSMFAAGDGFWLKHEVAGTVQNLEILNPHEMTVRKDPKTNVVTYHYRANVYRASQIVQVSLMKLPGDPRGLGPIQATQVELRGALELRDYASLWFSEGKIPSGILTSDQVLTADDAKLFKAAWNGTDEKPADNPSGVKVLGKGTTYTPIMLKPSDAQWLESRQFTTTQLARLFGVPASLMLAAVEGGSMTYANIEQDWIGFVRFTLMAYLRKIEDALTGLTVRGQKVKFNVDSLLRSDTLTRYQAHQLGMNAGFLTDDEVRAMEGRAPLTKKQREQMNTTKPAQALKEESA